MDVSDGLPLARRRLVMSCAVLGVVLAGLDSAIANIALPTIARDLAATDAATIWVVNSYQLAVTICLLPAAALGEIWGLKRIYGLGLIIFTVASLTCALSPTLPVLVASRLLQGVGGACMAALGGALVRTIFPRALLGRGYALIALSVALAAAAGPSLAALILSIAHWPWLFLVNVPVGAIAIPLFIKVAPAGERRARPFDWIGTAINAAAFGLIVTGVDGLGGNARGLALIELAVG
ncbi:MAG: MFS transporter, partial [Janthinobacterium lividum]